MPSLDWNAAIDVIKGELPQGQFHHWLKPIQFLSLNENTIVLGVPSRFHEQWIRNHYIEKISKVLHNQLGKTLELQFEVLEESTKSAPLLNDYVPNDAPIDFPGLKLVRNSQENDKAPRKAPNLPQFLSTFISSECNHIAYSCANLLISDSAEFMSPLVVVGGVGMGKSHLLSYIGKNLHSNQVNVQYTTGESFTSEVIQGYKDGNLFPIKKKYREGTDVLLFDDLQVLSGKLKTQEELLYIFNEIVGRGGHIVFGSQIPPQQLERFIDPLRSRLLSGVITEIKHPTFEERVELLKKKCEESLMTVDSPLLRSLASRVTKDIRELFGTLYRVNLEARLENRVLDEAFLMDRGIREVHPPDEVTMDDILSLVELNFEVTRSNLISKSRKSEISWARQVAMYLARTLTLLPLGSVGQVFGRDHATVLHAFQKVKDATQSTPSIRYQIEYLKNRLVKKRGEHVPSPS